MSEPRRRRVVVLISGRGSNMAALIEAARDENFPAEIIAVISDRADAPGLEIAAKAGIRTRVIQRGDFPDNAAHDASVHVMLKEFSAEFICLAGYMRLLTPAFAERWKGRLINIHPSLLPLHKGLDTHRRAIEAGDAEHGCSVHFVTAGMDEGPVILQARVPVLRGDTPEILAERVLEEEHKLYPEALRMVVDGKVKLENGQAVFAD